MMSLFRCYLIAGMMVGWAGAVHATTLVADLDLDEVAITTDFNGESLLLFETVSAGATSDIIVIFKGPMCRWRHARKNRLAASG